MKLRYWSLVIAAALLTYWGLSQVVSSIWAVTAAVWASTVAAFLGIVLTETREFKKREKEASPPTPPAGEG
ncbi:MAG TPA: hypothetical protein VFP14_13280 [Novosphingobium sp.]|nr:hypothetical protein [Novosphingobium sp.]